MYLSTLIILGLLLLIAYLVYQNRQLAGQKGEMLLKDDNKQKILDALAEGEPLSNEQLRELLGVSARSVVNYMDELEAAGQVEQIGTTGVAVTYRLKT